MKQPARQRERTGAAVHSDRPPQRPATGSEPSLTRPGTRSACAVADRRRRPRTQPRIHDRFDGRIAKVRRFPTGAFAAHFDAQIEHLIDQIERQRTHVCIVLIRLARTMRTALVKLHFRRCRRTGAGGVHSHQVLVVLRSAADVDEQLAGQNVEALLHHRFVAAELGVGVAERGVIEIR